MAIAHVSTSGWDETGAQTYTESFDATGGTLLVCPIDTQRGIGSPVSSVTYNGVGLTERINTNTAGDLIMLWFFTLENPASGANNLTVNIGGGLNTNTGLIASIYTGANATSFGNTAETDTTGTTNPITLSIGTNNSWHFSLHYSNLSKTQACADGTIRYKDDFFAGGGQLAFVTSSAGLGTGNSTHTVTWDGTSTEIGALSLEVKEAAGGGGANHWLLMGI